MDQTLERSTDYKSQNSEDFKLPANIHFLLEEETENYFIAPNIQSEDKKEGVFLFVCLNF